MDIHTKAYTYQDLWWILYKTMYTRNPIGIRGGNKYYNVACAFDIETTSFYINDEKRACMYIWMLGIDGYCIIGRTWEELDKCLNKIINYCGLCETVYLPIYVHNLSYEFQFIKDRFEWKKIFALDVRKTNYCQTKTGIEFRCSYQLSGTNLDTVGKNLQKYKVKKLVGSLDYSKIRHSRTPLTKEELQYCINDVLVVMAYIQECIDTEGDVTKIPLTKTGYVRREVKRKCRGTGKYKNKLYINLIKNLTLEPDEYLQLRRAFQGGFTHASALYSGEILHDVDSYDFTSSYPTVMLAEKFPMSKSRKYDIKTTDELEKYIEDYCCLFDITFINLRPKVLYEDYISSSRCRDLVEPVINNGRIVSAKRLWTTITEQDYFIIKELYTWEDAIISNFRLYLKQYLPREFRDAILTFYEDKTQLKDVEGKEVEYMQAKAMLNSLYGMTVTDICRDEIIYDGEWSSEKPNINEAIEKYNKAKARFLFYPWGVWVTAYARRNLFSGIIACNNDYVYSDTDSLKILHANEHIDYIEQYNELITKKIEESMKQGRFPINRTRPKTIEGIEKPIGIWDYEGHYETFKTLGAKRYLWKKKDYMQMTVAGLNKKIGLKYLQFAELSGKSVFEKFTDDMYIPKGWTGKMLHTYIDEPTSGQITDYLGTTHNFSELSSIHMENAEYTLSIGAQYADFLAGIHEVIT